MTINEITFQELDEALKILKFAKKKTKEEIVYSYGPLNAILKFRNPKTQKEVLNGGVLSGHAFILQEKGVIKQADVLFKIIEHQRFIKENVLV